MVWASLDRASSAGSQRSAERRTGARTAVAWREIAEPGADPAPKAGEPVAEPETPPEAPFSFDEADLARACAAVATTVRDAEIEAAAAREERRIADALEAIMSKLDSADEVLAQRRRQFREAAANLAAAVTEALAMGPGVEVAIRLADALAADCLARFDPEMALTVEVAPDIADALAARLASSPAMAARPGRVAVEPVASIAPGEARLVWPDGSADWSAARLHADAAALVRRLTEPETPSQSPETPPQNNESEPA